MTDFTFKNTLFWTSYASCAYFHVINLASYFRVGANRFSGLLVYEHENVSQVYQKRGKNSTLYKLCVWNALLLRTCSYFWYAIVPEVLGFSLFNDKTRSGVYFETYVYSLFLEY